eukprot:m.17299 g.17299  ORF g.17299 m.17299 type:complete len:122 (-) comp4761_c0_seq1:152-517(-)
MTSNQTGYGDASRNNHTKTLTIVVPVVVLGTLAIIAVIVVVQKSWIKKTHLLKHPDGGDTQPTDQSFVHAHAVFDKTGKVFEYAGETENSKFGFGSDEGVNLNDSPNNSPIDTLIISIDNE